jgi:Ca-activated chloride channel family protein
MRALAFAAALCVMAVPPAGAQRATFSSGAEAVRVDVAATNRGRPVAGLTADDFEIFDNGVRQTIQVIETDEVPIDLVMALDISGSVTGARLDSLRSASETLLGFLTARDRAGILTFNHEVVVRSPLSSDLGAVRGALDTPLNAGNRTALIDAAYAALALADGGAGRALAIVLSDGVDTTSWLTAADVIETAKRLDVVLFGVSTGAPQRTALDDLADATGGELVRIESRELTAVLERLMRDFRQRYLLSYTPQGVTPGGWHTLEVRAKK